MSRWIIPILFLAAVSCTDAPDFDDVPELTYIGIQNDVLAQSTVEDTVVIQLSVTDANGDIGENDAGDPSIFMTDEKDGFELPPFTLPRLSEQGTGKGIRADINLLFIVKKGDICCRYPDGTGGCIESLRFPMDSLFYDMYLVDHAGNESNHVRVGPIYLLCDDPN